jgi:ankyrin repeat protein
LKLIKSIAGQQGLNMQKFFIYSLTFIGIIISAETEIMQIKRDIRKAVQTGNVELLSRFSKDHVLNPVNLDNCKGYKMLAVACAFGQEGVVKFLLENGAEVNAVNKVKPGNFTALDVAEHYKHKVIVTLLRSNGAKHFKELSKSGQCVNCGN